MDVSILIVNYNTRELTINCLRSIFTSNISHSIEVILVDNASVDGTLQAVSELYPQVIQINNEQNVGFSRANNQALKIAKGRYILLLNSDTIVQPNTLEIMIRFMDEHPSIGASGCKIVLPNGSLDKACKRGFPTPKASFYYAFGFSKLFPNIPYFNQYQLNYLDPNKDYPVDCLVGAFMMVRKQAIDQVGILDEDFFMYGEDIDWCYRIKEAGWNIHYYPYTQILHLKGASSRRKPFKIIYEFHRAMYLFHKKHYQRRHNLVTNSFVYLGICIKFLLSVALNRFGSVR